MSSAKDRRIVVAAFAKQAVAETPLTSVTAVPGGAVPAVAGKKPIGKGKKVSPVPQVHTASFNGELANAISLHLEKEAEGEELPCPGSKIRSGGMGRGLGIGKGKGPIGIPFGKKKKDDEDEEPPKDEKKKEDEEKKSSILNILDKASMCGAMHSKKNKSKKKYNPGKHGYKMAAEATATRDVDDKSTQKSTPPTVVTLASASDTPPKKAEEKKPEPKESENSSEKKAAVPGIEAPPMEAMEGGDAPQPTAPEGQGGKQDLMSMIGEGLGTLGQKSMGSVGSVLGGLGMPGAEKQLQMWGEDPTISKGVGGGIGALGTLLVAYLVRKMMAGGGGGEGENDLSGLMQSAGLRCHSMTKQAVSLPPVLANLLTPAPTKGVFRRALPHLGLLSGTGAAQGHSSGVLSKILELLGKGTGQSDSLYGKAFPDVGQSGNI